MRILTALATLSLTFVTSGHAAEFQRLQSPQITRPDFGGSAAAVKREPAIVQEHKGLTFGERKPSLVTRPDFGGSPAAAKRETAIVEHHKDLTFGERKPTFESSLKIKTGPEVGFPQQISKHMEPDQLLGTLRRVPNKEGRRDYVHPSWAPKTNKTTADVNALGQRMGVRGGTIKPSDDHPGVHRPSFGAPPATEKRESGLVPNYAGAIQAGKQELALIPVRRNSLDEDHLPTGVLLWKRPAVKQDMSVFWSPAFNDRKDEPGGKWGPFDGSQGPFHIQRMPGSNPDDLLHQESQYWLVRNWVASGRPGDHQPTQWGSAPCNLGCQSSP